MEEGEGKEGDEADDLVSSVPNGWRNFVWQRGQDSAYTTESNGKSVVFEEVSVM